MFKLWTGCTNLGHTTQKFLFYTCGWLAYTQAESLVDFSSHSRILQALTSKHNKCFFLPFQAKKDQLSTMQANTVCQHSNNLGKISTIQSQTSLPKVLKNSFFLGDYGSQDPLTYLDHSGLYSRQSLWLWPFRIKWFC